jgi:hypothetical protein
MKRQSMIWHHAVSNSINSESAVVWKDKIPPHLMSKQTPKHIFRADLRAVLFITFVPKKTYTFKW